MGRLRLMDEKPVVDSSANDVNHRLEQFLSSEYKALIARAIQTSEAFYKAGLETAMTIASKESANLIVKSTAEIMMTMSNMSGKQAVAQFLEDVGYFAGYYDVETRLRVERLFDTEHPFLGKAINKDEWTTAELREVAIKLDEDFVILDNLKKGK